MLSTRVQQSPRLVDLAWLDRDSRLARLVRSVAHQKTAKYCGSELGEVYKKDHGYWNSTSKNYCNYLTKVLAPEFHVTLTLLSCSGIIYLIT